MQVIKRTGTKETVSFDKITKRISDLCAGLSSVDPILVAKDTINAMYDGISTKELDVLSANICSLKSHHYPDYNKLGGRILASNLSKSTSSSYLEVLNDTRFLLSPLFYDFCVEHIETIQSFFDYSRDLLFDYFAFNTLELSYLIRVNGKIVERPQHLWMRVAVQIHGCDIRSSITSEERLEKVKESYDYISQLYFTHATPTLFNSGLIRPQLSSCFLYSSDDNIEDIFKTISDTAKISKWAGGIGLSLSNIRSKGSMIRGTNGKSEGIVPLCKTLEAVGKYINQGGKRKGSVACFCEDTEVFTVNEGVKKIQNVKIGDLVVTHKNRVRPVTQVHKNPLNERKIYKLKVERNKDIYVTGNHKFWSFYTKKYKSNKISHGWNSIEELKIIMDKKETSRQACYISFPKETSIVDKNCTIDVLDYKKIILNEEELLIEDEDKVFIFAKDKKGKSKPINRFWNVNNDFANLIGIWLGDGYIKKSKKNGKVKVRGIGFTVHKYNVTEINYIKDVCKNVFGRDPTINASKNGVNIIVNSGIVGSIMMDMFGSYFNGKKLPDMIFNWSKNLVSNLMAGLITTDGHITKTKQNSTLSLSNEKLTNQLYHLCRNNGLGVSLVKCKIQKGQTCCAYTMSIPLTKDILDGVRKYYQDDRIKTCYEKLNQDQQDDTYLKILNISETDRTDEYVYTLGVEEDHSYTAEGLLAQNCYLEPWHSDIFDFVELRKNTGDENLRARDLFLALWVPDLFMKRVEQDGMWSLMCPDECPGLVDCYGEEFDRKYTQYEKDGVFKKQVKAKDVWEHIINCQIETGMPYMAFKDNVNRKNMQSHLGVIRNSNLCCEIALTSNKDNYAVCNLGSICLPKFVNVDTKTFDFEKLIQIAGVVTYNLNNVIDVNFYPVPETRKTNEKNRPIGIGVQGLADVYCMLGLPFGSDDARALNTRIFESIYYGSVKMSIHLAKRDGPYPSYDDSPHEQGKLQFDFWESASPTYDWDTVKRDMNQHGIRNSLLTALMPTASTSQIMGNNECFEPITTNIYLRKTLAGEFTVVNHHLINDLMKEGLWTKEIKEEILYDNGSIQRISIIPQRLKDIYKTAYELKVTDILKQAIDRSPYVDHMQSMNLYMEKATYRLLNNSHFYSWKNGLKTGMYYLRTQPAAEAIKFGMDASSIVRIRSSRKEAVLKTVKETGLCPRDPELRALCDSCSS